MPCFFLGFERKIEDLYLLYYRYCFMPTSISTETRLACRVCYDRCMKEIWKDVVGYEGLYKVSNLGRMMSVKYNGGDKQRIMAPSSAHGYKRVRLFRDKRALSTGVHRLVAQAFIPNPEDKPIINHKDGDKSNNCVDNLEWATQSENVVHAFHCLNVKAHGGRKKKMVCLVETGQTFESIKEASVVTGHNRTSIISCCKGRYKTVNGMHWKYL